MLSDEVRGAIIGDPLMGTNKDLFKQAQAFLIQVIQRDLIESKRMPGQRRYSGKWPGGVGPELCCDHLASFMFSDFSGL